MTTAKDPRIGQVVEGRYRILNRLASGGMGTVYRAERLQLGRTVAIKFLDAAQAGDDNSIARFEREARAMSLLSHPHCVSVIDFGVAKTPFIVMEFVTGQPLVSLIRARPVRAERALHIMHQVTAGLAHAHRHNIIHRDIKPANIMLTEVTGSGDFVRILDFGLAKLRGASALSSANVVVGTPSYMSPEQARGKTIDARSDIYSAGIVLYELLCGKKPFVGEDAFEILRLHQHEPVPLLPEIQGSDRLRVSVDALLQTALAKDPSDRFQTTLIFGDTIKRILETNNDRKRSSRIRDLARESTQLATISEALNDSNSSPGSNSGDSSSEDLSSEDLGDLSSGDSEDLEDSAEEISLADELQIRERKSRSWRWLTAIVLAAVAFLLVARWNSIRDGAKNVAHRFSATDDAGIPSKTTERSSLTNDASAMTESAPVRPPMTADTNNADLENSADPAPLNGVDASVIEGSPERLADGESVDSALLTDESSHTEPDSAPPDSAPFTNNPAATPGLKTVPTTLAEVNAALKNGKANLAALGLRRMIRSQPKNAGYHRLLGNANFKRGQRLAAIANYRRAIALRPRYRTFRSINQNVINALVYKKHRAAMERFLVRTLGRAVQGPLRSASRNHPNPMVRKRAALVLKRLR